MLLVITDKMSPAEKEKLMAVYEESNGENAQDMFPDDSPEIARKKVHEGFGQYLDEFLADPQNTYYIWEEQGAYRSALRLTKLTDFYYMEALETAPDCRRNGYAEKLMNAVITYLKRAHNPVIRSCVSKKNEKSLAFHKKCGFRIDQMEAVQYYVNPSVVNPRAFGMLYTGCE